MLKAVKTDHVVERTSYRVRRKSITMWWVKGSCSSDGRCVIIASYKSKIIWMIKKKKVLCSYGSSCNKCTKLGAHWRLHEFCIHLTQLIAKAITGQFLIRQSTHCALTPSCRQIYSIELLGKKPAGRVRERAVVGAEMNWLQLITLFTRCKWKGQVYLCP